MKKIIKYFRDYGAVLKIGLDFLKEHWFGTIILTIILTGFEWGGILLYGHWDEIKDRIRIKKKHAKGKREMQE